MKAGERKPSGCSCCDRVCCEGEIQERRVADGSMKERVNDVCNCSMAQGVIPVPLCSK